MKKITAFVLVCIFLLSSLLLVSCRKIDTTANGEGSGTDGSSATSATTTASSTTATTPSNESNEPETVKTVNGMNAKELVENVADRYLQSNSFDLSVSTTSTIYGMSITENSTVKFNDGDMYVYTRISYQEVKVWYVDETAYLNIAGQKYKLSAQELEDALDEEFVDGIMTYMPSALSAAYTEKLEGAKIYSADGEYYFTVTFTDAEAKQMELGNAGYTETMYFDSMGRLKRVVDSNDDFTRTVIFNSYGEPVSITAPSDADSYVEGGDILGSQGFPFGNGF